MAQKQENQTPWHKHPLFVGLVGGFLLWVIQFTIGQYEENQQKKTAHYAILIEHKIELYYELQKLSNKMVNEIRLLDKLIKYKNKNISTPFDLKEKIKERYKGFINMRVAYVNAHYENYMLQSPQAKKAYENLISYVSDEIKPDKLGKYPQNALQINDPSIQSLDFDISKEIGQNKFIQNTLRLWHEYMSILANELKNYKLNHDILPLEKLEN